MKQHCVQTLYYVVSFNGFSNLTFKSFPWKAIEPILFFVQRYVRYYSVLIPCMNYEACCFFILDENENYFKCFQSRKSLFNFGGGHYFTPDETADGTCDD